LTGTTATEGGAAVRTCRAIAGLGACAALLPAAGAAAQPRVIRDVAYDLDGSRPALARLGRLDVYRPAAARRRDRRGVVVYVHGGGWAIGDKSRVGAKAEFFTNAGFLFVSVNYRLSPRPPALGDPARVRFPDHPRDVGEAVAWLHRNAARYGGDGRRIALTGHSAGAHLVALVATDRSYLRRFRVPRAAVRGFVPLDTAAYWVAERASRPGRGGVLFQNAFGTPAEEQADPRWASASLLTHADRADPPALVVTKARTAARASAYAARLGGRPRATVLPLAKTHAEINRELGTVAGRASGENRAVMGFVRRVLGRALPRR
jgi:acetyl esterase/lipase